jgi:hypothetical protein
MEHKYTASADTVFGLLTDPKWLESRSLALGELSASCKTVKGQGVVVTMKRRVRRELSPIISKVLNPESDLEFEERWSGDAKGYSGTFTMQIVGKPISVSAGFELLPQGKGCVYRIRHEAKVKVPLIGGVIEKFVIAQTQQGCADELAYLAEFLKRKRQSLPTK